MADLKLYCIVSEVALAAMKGSRGKLGSQCGHAYLHAFWDCEERFPELARAYKDSPRAYKITLKAADTAALEELAALYKTQCGVSLVTDAGLTVFDGPTVTCLGIGPIDPDKRETILKGLKPL